ncbi:MAG: fluoride efflux transporter CrcB, partial [Bacteroidota bacterium]
MGKWTVLFIGGGVGTILRFLLSAWTTRQLGSQFPFGTLSVNLIGCLAIGFLAGSIASHPIPEMWRNFLFVGILGGFTTFSSFGLESLQLLRAGHVFSMSLYLVASNLGGLLL